ncbi:MAG: PTS transporter subunit EIIC [Brevinema sp.]
MKQDKYSILAESIVTYLGGVQNIKSVINCMTRVRTKVHQEQLVDIKSLTATEGVLGILEKDSMIQVVVGPGVAQKVCFIINNNILSTDQKNLPSADNIKQQTKEKYQTNLGVSLKIISNIFIPLLPGFIACGLIAGIANILTNDLLLGNIGKQFPNVIKLLTIMGSSVFFYMNALVGANSAKESGGSPVLGMMMAAILYNPLLNDINLFGIEFSAGRGGIFAILMAGILVAHIEKNIQKYIPNSLNLFVTPLLTVLITTPVLLLIIQPIGGLLSTGLSAGATMLLAHGGFGAGFILGGTFLPLVMTGIHQGLIPIMTDMLAQYGTNSLLPIFAMAGAGQVGASLAVLFKTKNTRLQNIIKGAIFPGILGIGEPLIYGVTLPLGKPFFAACIGGAVGGGVIVLFKVAALVPGALSGVLLAAAIVPNQIAIYLFAVLCAYISGFLATWILGFDDPTT